MSTTISRELANKIAFIDKNGGLNLMNPKQPLNPLISEAIEIGALDKNPTTLGNGRIVDRLTTNEFGKWIIAEARRLDGTNMSGWISFEYRGEYGQGIVEEVEQAFDDEQNYDPAEADALLQGEIDDQSFDVIADLPPIGFTEAETAVLFGVENSESEFRKPGDDRPFEEIVAEEFADAPAARPEKQVKTVKITEPKPKAEKQQRPCACGCGELVVGYFKQGHDQRAKGMLQRAVKANTPEAIPKVLKRWVLNDHAVAKGVTYDWAQFAPLFIPVMRLNDAAIMADAQAREVLDFEESESFDTEDAE